MGTYNVCMDIMPQQEGRLPIYLNRDVQYIVMICMYWYIVCVGIQHAQSMIRINRFLKFTVSKASRKIYLKKNLMRAKWARKIIWELNCCKRSEPKFFFFNWQFSTNSRKFKIRLFIFFPEETYLFSTFSRSEYLFPKSVSPPPPPLRIKWSSPYMHKEHIKKIQLYGPKKRFPCMHTVILVGWLVGCI